MVYLGDYLGQLLAELTTARLKADTATVYVAELYASHDLLKHFPVPHIRIRDIDLDIPVTVLRCVAQEDQGSEKSAATPQELLKRFQPLLKEQLKANSVRITVKDMKIIERDLKRVADTMVRPAELSKDTNYIADQFTSVVQRSMEEKAGTKELAPVLATDLRRVARVDFLGTRSPETRLEVGITTAEIREAPPESVIRLTLHVSEEGMEWTNIADDSEPAWRLIRE